MNGPMNNITFPIDLIMLDRHNVQKMMDTAWACGVRPTGWPERNDVVTINGRPASDYMSTDPVPEGHYTVISFLARFDPETIALMGPLDEATQRDGFWLSREHKRHGGSKLAKVLAPKVLQELGIDRVNVYPEALLRRRFGL